MTTLATSDPADVGHALDIVRSTSVAESDPALAAMLVVAHDILMHWQSDFDQRNVRRAEYEQASVVEAESHRNLLAVLRVMVQLAGPTLASPPEQDSLPGSTEKVPHESPMPSASPAQPPALRAVRPPLPTMRN